MLMYTHFIFLEELVVKNKKLVYFFCKRVFDIIFSLIGLVFLIPSCIIIKILYLITGDFNNIFFVQDRIGLNGKNFKFYKFRTMFVDADDILEEILKTDSELAIEYRKNKKIKNDPRITKIGRFIRNSSLDELPQILNILKNDMSLIGNRPYLPREKKAKKKAGASWTAMPQNLHGRRGVADAMRISFMTPRRPSPESGPRDKGMERLYSRAHHERNSSRQNGLSLFPAISNLNLNLNYSPRSVKSKIIRIVCPLLP